MSRPGYAEGGMGWDGMGWTERDEKMSVPCFQGAKGWWLVAVVVVVVVVVEVEVEVRMRMK